MVFLHSKSTVPKTVLTMLSKVAMGSSSSNSKYIHLRTETLRPRLSRRVWSLRAHGEEICKRVDRLLGDKTAPLASLLEG